MKGGRRSFSTLFSFAFPFLHVEIGSLYLSNREKETDKTKRERRKKKFFVCVRCLGHISYRISMDGYIFNNHIKQRSILLVHSRSFHCFQTIKTINQLAENSVLVV